MEILSGSIDPDRESQRALAGTIGLLSDLFEVDDDQILEPAARAYLRAHATTGDQQLEHIENFLYHISMRTPYLFDFKIAADKLHTSMNSYIAKGKRIGHRAKYYSYIFTGGFQFSEVFQRVAYLEINAEQFADNHLEPSDTIGRYHSQLLFESMYRQLLFLRDQHGIRS